MCEKKNVNCQAHAAVVPMGNSTVQPDKLLPMLWRTCCCIFRQGIQAVATDSSKMLEIPMTTLGHNLNLDCCKNLKPRTLNTHTK